MNVICHDTTEMLDFPYISMSPLQKPFNHKGHKVHEGKIKRDLRITHFSTVRF